MKKFITNEIYHISPSTVLNKSNNNKDIVFENIANSINELHEYNEQGYNIYKTFNTFFDGKRTTDNLNELRAILIDLDYPNKKKDDYIEIRKKCKNLERKYGIFPTEINNTFKGYHLIFSLDKSLYYIDNDIYMDIVNSLVEYFQADKAAKQITGLYKVFGFVDHKDNRQFLIENYYYATSKSKELHSIKFETLKLLGNISEDTILKDILKTKIYGVKTNWNNEGMLHFSESQISKNSNISKLYEIVEKKTKKHDIYDLIESIDAYDFINAINNYEKGYFKGIKIGIHNKTIGSTSGLKLYYNNNKWEIKDFSNKKRFGNRLFLLNYILNLNEEKSEKIRKEKVIEYINFLRDSFGIKFASSVMNFSINKKLIYDYINNKIILDENEVNKYKKAFNINFNKSNTEYIDSIIYLYLLIERKIQESGVHFKSISFEYSYILSLLGINNNYKNIRLLKFILSIGTIINLNYVFTNANGKIENKLKKLYSVKLDKTSFIYYSIIGTTKIDGDIQIKGFIDINDNILDNKGIFNKYTNIKLYLYIIMLLKERRIIKISINQILNILGNNADDYKDEKYKIKKTKEIMNIIKDKKIITFYERLKTTYKIGRGKINK